MGKVKSEMMTRCELALMGKVVLVNSNDEVQEMTEYILKAMDRFDADSPKDIMKDGINKYCTEDLKESYNNVKYMVCNTVMGMKCITYLLESSDTKDGEYYYPAPFEEDYGSGYPCAFCYTYNVDSDWCSELGDCFFSKRTDGFYHRVS